MFVMAWRANTKKNSTKYLSEVEDILLNQQEVMYLTYLVYSDVRTGVVTMIIGAAGFDKEYKFKNVDKCLEKLYDILMNIKRKEAWTLSRN